MGRISYLIKSMKENIDAVSKKTEKLGPMIAFDMVWCGLRYGASPANYNKFQFYNLDGAQRGTYVTNRMSELLIKKYNQQDYRKNFEDKVCFAKTFDEFFGREWIAFPECGEDSYNAFIAKNKKIICKPNGGSQGNGILVFTATIPDYEKMKKLLVGNCIIESFIEQHSAVAEYYRNAVSCVRVITILQDGVVHPIVANITFGSKYEIANASFGGITAQVDVKNGKTVSSGGGFDGKIYIKHPDSNKEIKGFYIPFWEEILNMLSKAGKLIPQVGYVGWDVAIATDGPILIEGNTSPGYTFFQIPELLEGLKGTKEYYRPFL